jgi:hypothetical protein
VPACDTENVWDFQFTPDVEETLPVNVSVTVALAALTYTSAVAQRAITSLY